MGWGRAWPGGLVASTRGSRSTRFGGGEIVALAPADGDELFPVAGFGRNRVAGGKAFCRTACPLSWLGCAGAVGYGTDGFWLRAPPAPWDWEFAGPKRAGGCLAAAGDSRVGSRF